MVPDPTSLFNYNFGETFRNIALGVTGVIFVFAALTSLAAAIAIGVDVSGDQNSNRCEREVQAGR